MEPFRIASPRLCHFATELLLASGLDNFQAGLFARILVWCDEIGRSNQGVWRLPLFAQRISAGLVKTPCAPGFVQKGAALGMLDGDNGVGHCVAHIAMEHAIELARTSGVGCVGVRNSNHFGAGAYYVNLAAERGMIGMAMSNAFPKVAPFGGVRPVLGTNPFAFGAPRRDGRCILVDFATSASAGSTVSKRLEEKKQLPAGIAIDGKGQPITDPALIDSGALLPFGGAKGFGLALMVEILSGVITGAGFSHTVHSTIHDAQRAGNNGHWFMALDISALMPLESYYERMETLVSWVKASTEDFEDMNVLLPGEGRWNAYAEAQTEGVLLDPGIRKTLEAFASELKVAVPWV
jgi:LDH2 family malate/lactate/ureidoglycolate dehydrogenase